MDAISFVLGVQSKHLRSNHLKELIFRKNATSPPARSASVKLIYSTSKNEVPGRSEGSQIEFLRSINASGAADYHIDGKKVTYDAYEKLLQQIGVLVKARNFLVFQGDVETVASKSPFELTKLMEQISGSDLLSEEYDELKKIRDEAEENTLFSMQKRKMYVTQCKEVKGQKDEAEAYLRKQEDLDQLKTEYFLWQLWRIKSDMEDRQGAAAALRLECAEVRQREADLDRDMELGKAELAKSSKALSVAEKDLQGKNKQLDLLSPKLSETRAKLKSLTKRSAEQERMEAKVRKDWVGQVALVDEIQQAGVGA